MFSFVKVAMASAGMNFLICYLGFFLTLLWYLIVSVLLFFENLVNLAVSIVISSFILNILYFTPIFFSNCNWLVYALSVLSGLFAKQVWEGENPSRVFFFDCECFLESGESTSFILCRPFGPCIELASVFRLSWGWFWLSLSACVGYVVRSDLA